MSPLFSSGPPASVIRGGEPLEARQRWSRAFPGYAAQCWAFHRPSASLFIGDGWGVAFRSISLRRYDLATGEELARFRIGTGARCMAWLPGDDELVVAADTRLHVLQTSDLAERVRFDRRIPRYVDSMAIVRDGAAAVVANWQAPSASIVDVGSGDVRRRAGLATMLVLGGRAELLLVGGSSAGGLASIDPTSGNVRRLADTPPAIDATLDDSGTALWITAGPRAIERPNVTGPGRPTRDLRLWPLDEGVSPRRYLLPADVRLLRRGEREMWLSAADVLVAVPLPVGETRARIWRPPRDHEIDAFNPDERVAVAVKLEVRNGTGLATAFDLE
jgi:hypothetical protein